MINEILNNWRRPLNTNSKKIIKEKKNEISIYCYIISSDIHNGKKEREK